MAKTRRPLVWDDLPIGRQVRLTAKVEHRTIILEGTYLGLDILAATCYAFVRTADGDDLVPAKSVIRKQLLVTTEDRGDA